MNWRLKQTKQCSTCPWLVDATVANIPNYQPENHKRLISTIAEQGIIEFDLPAMSCHHAEDGEPGRYCIGWLSNQIGPGNNIGMRLKMLSCENSRDIQLAGEQVETFEETFK